MRNSSHIIYLIKFVEKIEYATDFLSGILFCNPWGYFKSVEDKQRKDHLELAAAKLQSKIYIKQTNTLYGLWLENTEDFFSPVFCMYSIYSRRHLLPDKLQLHHKSLREFGKYGVVIKNVKEFIDRLNTILPEFCYGLIEYIDYDNLTDGNQFALHNPIIQKDRKKFAHQQEFRIYNKHYAITNNSEYDLPNKKLIPPNEYGAARFSIGDLSDIAEIFSMDELFFGIEIKFLSSVSKKELSKEVFWDGKKYQKFHGSSFRNI